MQSWSGVTGVNETGGGGASTLMKVSEGRKA